MGLKVTTLARLPESTGWAFFVCFLDHGWNDELRRAMYENFDALAEMTAENRSSLIAGLHGTEFANEVLSSHRIDNDPAGDLLPAIIGTDVEPDVGAIGIDLKEVYGWSKENWQALSGSRHPA